MSAGRGAAWGTNPGPHNDLDEVVLDDEIPDALVDPDEPAATDRADREAARARIDERCAQGDSYYRLLHQTQWWNAESGRVRLDDMQDSHRANLLGWLDVRAAQIADVASWYWVAELGRPHGGMATMALEDIAEEEWNEIHADPLAWLRATPFYRRLLELRDRDHVAVALPDRPAGAPAPRPLAEVTA